MLDPDRLDGIRFSVAETRALGETSLQRIGYPADEAAIITDQVIDNALRGYHFASLPRTRRGEGIVLDRKVVDALNAF